MTVEVEESIAIDRPRHGVAAYAMDPANDTSWIRALTRVELLTDPPVRVGTRVRRVAQFLGRSVDYVLEVADYEPGRRLAMRSVRAPFPMLVTYLFADQGGGTRATIRVQGDTGRFYRLAGPLLAGQVRRGVRGDLERLKRNLEADGAPDGG
jgi:uncharacterized membrane protein